MKKFEAGGGVIVNSKGRIAIVNQNNDSWSLPKGKLEAGEDHLSAARREIYEETGITELKLVKELGDYERYRIGYGGQGEDRATSTHFRMFLFSTNEEKLAPQFPDITGARWAEREKVAGILTHPKDKAFFLSIIDQIP